MAREENPYPGRKRTKGSSINTDGNSFEYGEQAKPGKITITKPKPSPPPPPKK